MNNLITAQYVRCIDNRQFIRMSGEEPPDEAIYGLTIAKVYKRVPDSRAEQHGMIRVIDEAMSTRFFGKPKCFAFLKEEAVWHA